MLFIGSDVDALIYGLKRFPALRRMTITPAAHGWIFAPLYETPMIRALLKGLNYPILCGWPTRMERHDRRSIPEEVPAKQRRINGVGSGSSCACSRSTRKTTTLRSCTSTSMDCIQASIAVSLISLARSMITLCGQFVVLASHIYS